MSIKCNLGNLLKAGGLGIMGCLLSVCIFSTSLSQNKPSINTLISRADSLYDVYDYAGSADLYQQAALADSGDFEAFWKAGRSLNYMGEITPKDSQLAIFEKARDIEKRALELNASSADAHFQLARALGKIALFKGVFNSVGLAKQVKREADRALVLDSLHDGAWHVLGRWHREVGKKPKLLRVPMGLGEANKEDALADMIRAVTLRPNFIHHRLELGITYLEYGQRDQARTEFEYCLSLPAEGPLDNKYQEEAKKYLARMDEK